MSTPEAGWYDDPWSATQYRYWDGAMWTPHVAPRQVPPQAQISPLPSSPSTPAPTTYGGPGGPTPYSGYASGGSTGVQGGYAGGHPGTQQGGQYPGQTPGQYPGGYPGPGAPTAPQWRPTFGPTTPDGVPIATRWARLGGRLLDNLFVTILAFPLNFYFIRKYNAASQDWLEELDRRRSNGENPSPFDLPGDMIKWLVPIAIVTIIVGVIYEAIFLTRSGATPGKHIVGTAVRAVDNPAIPPAEGLVIRRVAGYYSYQLLYIVPLFWPLLALIFIVDNGWLLWDRKRQTLHDKFARSVVVKNR